MIARINTWITRALLVLAAGLAFLLCFLVVADVIGRVIFNSPVKGTPEIVSTSIVIICFLQAAYAIRSGAMMQVDVFTSMLPLRGRAVFALAGSLLGAAFFGLVFWGSIDPAAHAWTSNEFEGEGALRVPAWPTRFVILIGTGLAVFNYLLLAVAQLRSAISGRAAETDPG